MNARAFYTCIIVMVFLFSSMAWGGMIDENDEKSKKPLPAQTDQPMKENITLGRVQSAFNTSDSKANVERLPFHEDFTYKIRLREFMTSTVVLPQEERIESYILGDQYNFRFSAIGLEGKDKSNVFTVWGILPGADTNLTVFGVSGNIYNFYLRIDSVNSNELPRFVTYLQDKTVVKRIKPIKNSEEIAVKQQIEKEAKKIQTTIPAKQASLDYLNELPQVKPSDVNFEYSIIGQGKIAETTIYQ